MGMPSPQSSSYGPAKPCPLVNNGDRREAMGISADCWMDGGSDENRTKSFKYLVAINCVRSQRVQCG